MIRARRLSHLESLQRRFGALARLKIATSPERDYRYRLIVTKAVWAGIVTELALEQEWSNFKEEAAKFQPANFDYIHALHNIWCVMHDLQENEALRRA